MKSMKLILREEIKSLGKKGETVSVAEGYARNFLLPKGLAVPVSEGKLKEATLIQDGRLKKVARLQQYAEGLAGRLQGLTLTISTRTGESGKLYGAVTSKDIAQELERVLGQPFDKRKLELPEPIKTLGAFPVTVRLHPGLVVTITVNVVVAS
ncbi:MAG: 50S ribosomal protein L9 [Thermacetogeniaceae bacterium]